LFFVRFKLINHFHSDVEILLNTKEKNIIKPSMFTCMKATIEAVLKEEEEKNIRHRKIRKL